MELIWVRVELEMFQVVMFVELNVRKTDKLSFWNVYRYIEDTKFIKCERVIVWHVGVNPNTKKPSISFGRAESCPIVGSSITLPLFLNTEHINFWSVVNNDDENLLEALNKLHNESGIVVPNNKIVSPDQFPKL